MRRAWRLGAAVLVTSRDRAGHYHCFARSSSFVTRRFGLSLARQGARSMLADTVFRFDEDATYNLLLSPHSADAGGWRYRCTLLRKGRVAEGWGGGESAAASESEGRCTNRAFCGMAGGARAGEQLLYAGQEHWRRASIRPGSGLGLQADSLRVSVGSEAPRIAGHSPKSGVHRTGRRRYTCRGWRTYRDRLVATISSGQAIP